MAGDSKKLQPIIIKRVRKGGHNKHGGAWKIAYADFVTAMMAFFLLMWLLGSTTEGDKKGIADFFNAPLKVALLGGSGAGDSSHVVRGGGQDLSRTTGQVKQGDVPSKRKLLNIKSLEAEQKRAEVARLEALKKKVEDALSASPKLAAMKSQIRLDMTRDGLRIQIVDEQSRPMFDSGSAVVKPYMRELLREIGHVLSDVPNRITLEGHTDAQPFSAGERGYSNWELSSDRANASRREIVAGGLPEDRMLLVQGLASSNLFVPNEPTHPDEPAHQHHRHEPRRRGPAPEAAAEPGRKRHRDGRRGHGRRAGGQALRPRMRVLVVDDFLTMRRVVRGFLREMGFDDADVAEAAHGTAALEALRAAPADVVITDIEMPILGGFGLLSAIKKDAALREVPVLMVTAEARKDEIVRCMQAGAAAYLVKPFTRETLEEKLRAAVPARALRDDRLIGSDRPAPGRPSRPRPSGAATEGSVGPISARGPCRRRG
jgi:chemotaxis protein MotB